MAKVFDGGAFLAEKATELKLSNGFSVTVSDIADEGIDKLSLLEGTEAPSVQTLREVLAAMVGVEVEKLEGVRITELQGCISFLSKSMSE